MPSVATPAGLALILGAACAVLTGLRLTWLVGALPLLLAVALVGYVRRLRLAVEVAVLVGCACAGATLASDARDRALYPPLRTLLDAYVGGFALETQGPAGPHEPILIRGVLLEDAAQVGEIAVARVAVASLRIQGAWTPVEGNVGLSIGGAPMADGLRTWLAGRTVQAPVIFRRPARYLDEGVPDFERELSLDGTTLFASTKSGLLVEVFARGAAIDEWSGMVRLAVRERVARWVAPYSAVSAAIVNAVLIGDRSGLPDDARLRLQAAGTYHVIAISGGNIAILAAVSLGALMLLGVSGRPAAIATLLVLLGYARVVVGGPSVWRATMMAALYLSARALDHRAPSWHALVLTGCLVVCSRPLDVRSAGFLLTFGATAALLDAARRLRALRFRSRALQWLAGSIAASLAVETILYPVAASTFSRVTIAGVVLNLVAVPMMAVVQIAGLVVVAADPVAPVAAAAAWMAHAATLILVDSARLVDQLPWLSLRVPPPSPSLVVGYYAGLAAALTVRRARRVGAIVCLTAAAAICAGPLSAPAWSRSASTVRIDLFDVGQGDSTLLRFPNGGRLLVDAGGVPGSSVDIGGRVLAPALWSQGIRSIDTLLLTHGDPDHIGGAAAVIDDFAPARVWHGILVLHHAGLSHVFDAARRRAVPVEPRRAGDTFDIGGVHVRVLNPPAPEWERQKVRNDDSVVIEARYGDVAVLLTGDIGAEVERSLVPQLTAARTRILKVAHHGSRTSSSSGFLEAWRPQIAVVSCGRGNRFGHPAPEVLDRLEAIGAAVYRTDHDGQVTIETDGRDVHVRTFVGGVR